jgi:hypothetical protein
MSHVNIQNRWPSSFRSVVSLSRCIARSRRAPLSQGHRSRSTYARSLRGSPLFPPLTRCASGSVSEQPSRRANVPRPSSVASARVVAAERHRRLSGRASSSVSSARRHRRGARLRPKAAIAARICSTRSAPLRRSKIWLSSPSPAIPRSRSLSALGSLRNNFTAYDALYVALAEALDTPLVTSDEHLASAACTHPSVPSS